MNMKEWGKNEVKLACAREKKFAEESGNAEDASYGIECYKSALKAFNSLLKDGHSGYSIGLTHAILDRLIEGRPLTPIEDTPDVWDSRRDMYSDGRIVSQCKRMSSLFKTEYPDGRVEYTDNDRVYAVDIDTPTVVFHSGLINKIINEMFPITMPYTGDDKYMVYSEDFLVDPANGDFDTKGIFYVIKKGPNGEEKIKINRYFREFCEDEQETYPAKQKIIARSWVEISKTTYNRRKKKAEARVMLAKREAEEMAKCSE